MVVDAGLNNRACCILQLDSLCSLVSILLSHHLAPLCTWLPGLDSLCSLVSILLSHHLAPLCTWLPGQEV